MTNQIKIVGTIHHIKQIEQISDKFKKREIVIQTDAESKFPQLISMQLTNDKCDLANNLNFGDSVECMINLRGREWIDPKTSQTRFFNTIECWSINYKSQSFSDRTQHEMTTKSPENPETSIKPKLDQLDLLVGDDDLPF